MNTFWASHMAAGFSWSGNCEYNYFRLWYIVVEVIRETWNLNFALKFQQVFVTLLKTHEKKTEMHVYWHIYKINHVWQNKISVHLSMKENEIFV